MFKVKNVCILLAFIGVIVASVMVPVSTTQAVLAVSEGRAQERMISEENEAVSPRLFAKLTISLDGGNGYVWATVKNDFTLFPSTVKVILELYSSDSTSYNYQDMTLIASETTPDLNMGSAIEARASTSGRQKYWMGRVRYQENGGNTQELITPLCLYNAEGNLIRVL